MGLRAQLLFCFIAFILMCRAVSAAETPPMELLRAAPEVITVADCRLILKAELWRDFMPISPPDGKPLIASLVLQTIGKACLPPGVQVEAVWVVNDKAVWSPSPMEVHKGDDSTQMEIVVRNGPKWGPGIKVDVVVRVRDAQGQAYLLKAPRQEIQRTD
ncbi:MAG TPA: hypothetical protein DCZ75_10550 [Geobacter sp.]|nr:hypothetical protein [Geobacter sp.]